jgi:hypothetical protein
LFESIIVTDSTKPRKKTAGAGFSPAEPGCGLARSVSRAAKV